MAKAKTPMTTIDRIRTVSPRYAELLEKSAELTARHEAVLSEIAPLSEQERRTQVSWVAQTPKPQPKPKHRHAGAVALVGDLLSPQPAEELKPPPPRPSFPGEDRLRELGAESESISEALRLLASELAVARRSYSLQVATQRKDDYQQLAEAVVDAARKLGDAVLAHHEFIDELRRDGVGYQALRPLHLEPYGNLGEPGTILLRTIMDAVERGHIGAGKIPAWRMPVDVMQNSGGDI